jgi:hypothetical protein
VNEENVLAQRVADRSAADDDRIRDVGVLGKSDQALALEALLAVAQAPDERTEVSRAAGAALAAVYFRRGRLDDAPLHDFSGDAYLAFDEEVARLQRAQAHEATEDS